MKQILFLTALAILFIINTATSNAKEFVDKSKEIALTVTNDERHIEKERDTTPGSTPRSIVFQPIYCYLYSKIISLNFTDTFSMVSVIITDNFTGETVYAETYSNPATFDIELNGENSGDYLIRIEADTLCLEGSFNL